MARPPTKAPPPALPPLPAGPQVTDGPTLSTIVDQIDLMRGVMEIMAREISELRQEVREINHRLGKFVSFARKCVRAQTTLGRGDCKAAFHPLLTLSCQ